MPVLAIMMCRVTDRDGLSPSPNPFVSIAKTRLTDTLLVCGNSEVEAMTMTTMSDDKIDVKPTILLVDDQHSIRHILGAGLKAHGFEVLTAASAEKAIAFCEGYEGHIDLLLTDISLTPQNLWPNHPTQDDIPHGVAVAERAIQLRPSMK